MKKKDKVYTIALLIVFLSLVPRLVNFDSTVVIGTVHSLRQLDVATIARNIYMDPMTFFTPLIDRGESFNTVPPMKVGLEFQLMPLLVAILYSIFGIHTSFGPIVSLLFYIGSCWAIYKISRYYLTEIGCLFSLTIFCFSSQYIVYSSTFMPESEVIFFLLITFLLFKRYLSSPNNCRLVLFFVSLTLSMLVKLTNAYMLPVYFYLWVINLGKFKLKDRILLIGVGVLGFLLTLLYYWLVNKYADTPYVSNILSDKVFKNLGSKYVDIDFWELFFKYMIMYFAPIGFLVFLLGVFRVSKCHFELIVWLFCVVLFEHVSGYNILVNHIYYFLPTVPIVSLICGLGFQDIKYVIGKLNIWNGTKDLILVLIPLLLITQLLFLYKSYGFTGDATYAKLQRQEGENLKKVLAQYSSNDGRSLIGLLRWEEYPVLYYSEQLGWMFAYDENGENIKANIQELKKKGCKFIYVSPRDKDSKVAELLKSELKLIFDPRLEGLLLKVI
ncbi:ArnT family glycosyltransferase [Aneurinibacillus danicus]|uniref:Glycosyltransferase RgtA/B/C/D-like domain-containing protein n=1 Tax=Aneurinibacillus danicus TaxID=267746 RepID=A0A511V889_9BACL|nr:glycosyltransferase family 39 protein [Aneurinibacillus danicus]GEN35156.1 hypothetical protein ADA01nite_26160 [Aneurinibacillus danicus]